MENYHRPFYMVDPNTGTIQEVYFNVDGSIMTSSASDRVVPSDVSDLDKLNAELVESGLAARLKGLIANSKK